MPNSMAVQPGGADNREVVTLDSCLRVNRLLVDSLSPDSAPTASLEPLEWDALWRAARDHCLVPYLHKVWTESGFITALPSAIAQRFSAARANNTVRNRRLILALDELRTALHDRGIAVLISKGLPVEHSCYGEPGLRVMYDLDLLVKPHDRARAVEVLGKIGYTPFYPHSPASQCLFWRPKSYVWDADRVFDPDQPIFVELHSQPWEAGWHGFGIKCNLDLWKGERALQMSGVTLRVPTEERLLVHLAVHYACNVLESNARLMHLLDIVLLLRLHAAHLNWSMIVAEIRESRAMTFCFLALDLAGRLGGCQIPERILKELRDATPRGIVDWLCMRGLQDAASMSLRHRDRRLIYFLHWQMAAGCFETASVLIYSLRAPWSESTGVARWKILGSRICQRLHCLARAS